eukprot:1928730-Pyramimonas_sp.AAC.1
MSQAVCSFACSTSFAFRAECEDVSGGALVSAPVRGGGGEARQTQCDDIKGAGSKQGERNNVDQKVGRICHHPLSIAFEASAAPQCAHWALRP